MKFPQNLRTLCPQNNEDNNMESNDEYIYICWGLCLMPGTEVHVKSSHTLAQIFQTMTHTAKYRKRNWLN